MAGAGHMAAVLSLVQIDDESDLLGAGDDVEEGHALRASAPHRHRRPRRAARPGAPPTRDALGVARAEVLRERPQLGRRRPAPRCRRFARGLDVQVLPAERAADVERPEAEVLEQPVSAGAVK